METNEEIVKKEQANMTIREKAEQLCKRNPLMQRHLKNYKIFSMLSMLLLLGSMAILCFAPCLAEGLIEYSWFDLAINAKRRVMLYGDSIISTILVFAQSIVCIFLIVYSFLRIIKLIGHKGNERALEILIRELQKEKKERGGIYIFSVVWIIYSFIYQGLPSVLANEVTILYWVLMGVLVAAGIVMCVLKAKVRKPIVVQMVKEEYYEDGE